MAWRAPRLRLWIAAAVSAGGLSFLAPAALGLGPVPVNTGLPVISGSAVQGATLTCSPGSWQFSPTSYAYTWQRTGFNIAGATSNQYTLTSSDVGQPITCSVVASNANGPSLVPATSLPVTPGPLPSGPVPVDVLPPTISGSTAPGQTVACSTGTWVNTPTGYSYSWQRDGTDISGQTSNQYTLADGDVGQAITCTVVASNSSGSGPPAISLPVVPTAASGSGGGGSGGGSGSGSGGSGSGGSGGSGGAGGGGGSAGIAAPVLKSLAVVPSRVTVQKQGKRQSTKGAAFTFQLDRAAGVVFYVQQKLPGRRTPKGCVAPGKVSAQARRTKGTAAKGTPCARWKTVSVLSTTSGQAGRNRYSYSARVGKRVLAAGTYRVVAAATNAGGWSNIKSAQFSVVQKQTKPKRPTGHQ